MAVVHVNQRCRHNESPLSEMRWRMMQLKYDEALKAAAQLTRSDVRLSDEDQTVLHFLIIRCKRARGELDEFSLIAEAQELVRRALAMGHYELAADTRGWLLEFYARGQNSHLAERLAEAFFDDGIPKQPGLVALRDLALARLTAWRQGVAASLVCFDKIVVALDKAAPAAPCVHESVARYYAVGLRQMDRDADALRVLRRAGVDPSDVVPELPYYRL